ncbi:MAG: TIGR03905 family TSCPD domain-containing protein [Lachnospiraceae bacterium]|nr:TIGR03905 family TSCPD domain-containing protein [Lachnospiraceae bacterium]
MKHYQYRCNGTCSMFIDFDLEDGKLHNVVFTGGCHGNLQGIGRLVEGMDAQEVIDRVDGIRCGYKPTSCPDQLAHALKAALKKQA